MERQTHRSGPVVTPLLIRQRASDVDIQQPLWCVQLPKDVAHIEPNCQAFNRKYFDSCTDLSGESRAELVSRFTWYILVRLVIIACFDANADTQQHERQDAVPRTLPGQIETHGCLHERDVEVRLANLLECRINNSRIEYDACRRKVKSLCLREERPAQPNVITSA